MQPNSAVWFIDITPNYIVSTVYFARHLYTVKTDLIRTVLYLMEIMNSLNHTEFPRYNVNQQTMVTSN